MTNAFIATVCIFAFMGICLLQWELHRTHVAQVRRDERNHAALLEAKRAGQETYLCELPSGTQTCYAPVNDYALHVRRTSAPC